MYWTRTRSNWQHRAPVIITFISGQGKRENSTVKTETRYRTKIDASIFRTRCCPRPHPQIDVLEIFAARFIISFRPVRIPQSAAVIRVTPATFHNYPLPASQNGRIIISRARKMTLLNIRPMHKCYFDGKMIFCPIFPVNERAESRNLLLQTPLRDESVRNLTWHNSFSISRSGVLLWTILCEIFEKWAFWNKMDQKWTFSTKNAPKRIKTVKNIEIRSIETRFVF